MLLQVAEFRAHHYVTPAHSKSAVTRFVSIFSNLPTFFLTRMGREWVRRLANEYSDLSKVRLLLVFVFEPHADCVPRLFYHFYQSLPIYPDSSVFMRVHGSKMSYAQVQC